MPFYFRKSVSAGPFRFNFSKSGLGVSVGVKGFRVGTGPRGHYVHAGRGGIYYRATIGRSGQSRRGLESFAEPVPPILDYAEPGVAMVEVESGSVLAMSDERFSDLLDDINAKQRQTPMSAVLGWGGGIFGVLLTMLGGPGFAILTLILAGIGFGVGKWLDSYRRTSVLFYELEAEAAAQYERLTQAFDRLMKCSGTWHIGAGGQVRDIHTWKRNAGASTLLDRKDTALGYGLPNVVRSNVTPPMLQVGRQTLYFLPDVLLVLDGQSVGAVAYQTLQLSWQRSNFIEDSAVPGDTRVLYHTWRYPYKKGGPDRRFANNYQIPVCEYEALHLTSGSGLNELLQFSCAGVSEPFAQAVRQLSYARPAERQRALTAAAE
jgi:hypothetical protein